MTRQKAVLTILFMGVLGAVSTVDAAVPGTVVTFETGVEGFQGSTISTTQIHSATGGNPDGHVVIRKEVALGFDIGTRNSATAALLGDYAADGVTGAGFDLNVGNFSLDEAHLRFRRSPDENGWYYDFGAVSPNLNQWEEYDVFFDPTWSNGTALANGWTQEVDAPSFAALMGDVDWIEVRVIADGSLIVGVDNVRLLPEPSTILLLGAGLALTRIARRRYAQ